ncbi:MAG: IS110 family transposase [Deltaproteobacteria bacterium]|nr:IS110 family transposase [Deltaproteobacteria bacterium]
MTKYTQEQLRKLDTIGCDLGDKKSELFVIGAKEATWRPDPIATTRDGFRKFFEDRKRAHVVLEVGTHSRWTSALLEELGHMVTVANPRNVKLISESNRKDDDVDAEILARLGRADVKLLSPIKHRGEGVQADLAIPKGRDALVRCRTKLINQARGLVKSFGCRLPKCDAAYFHRQTKEFVPEALKPALLPLYEVLEELAKRIAAFDKTIEELVRTRYPDAEHVSQMKGVGLLTGLVFILTLEDKSRFARSRDVGPFVGLNPRRRKSGNSDPQLHITKAGDEFLRRLLVQDANYILGPLCRQDSDLRRWALKLCERGGKAARKRAKVALARKLAVLMHRLWVSGEVYEPLGYRQDKKKAHAA